MGDVIKLHPSMDPDEVLAKAAGQFADVLVIGYDSDGVLDVRASGRFKNKDILFAIESFKFKLIRGDYSDD